MNPFRVSAAARSDLEGIWFYIAQDDPAAADKFIQAVVSRFPKLAGMPGLGRRRHELSPRLRSFPVGRYVIFIVRWKRELKSFASCMARGISRLCLNNNMTASCACPTNMASLRCEIFLTRISRIGASFSG